ncbi:hypothetical protein V6N12_070463 [Hibiscus sabdariffa]|uniref:Myb-like domain-containing protein n=1 Tax=Hibiscus sabdariffa TaxID=183260 RepID=A0ABR2FHH1_9ROSI
MGDSGMAEGSTEADMVPGIHGGSEGEEDKGRVDEGGRSSGGNRWPRQETLALLKIRSDMDSVFRDSTLKGPLWEEVSRKLAELGYHRSAKKCKEKFENVYKYNKRTKDGRTTKADGPDADIGFDGEPYQCSSNQQRYWAIAEPYHFHPGGSYESFGKKRKWKEFFKRLTKEVIERQEELQNKFLQTIEKCEQRRVAREDAWRIQEMGRINKEHGILVQERSKAAAKDAAVLAFLQKISAQQVQPQQENPPPPPPQPILAPLPLPPPLQQPKSQSPTQALNIDNGENNKNNNVVRVLLSPSPSRWPKAEIEALIKLRTNLDIKYQENGPKGPLWEEISSAMRNLGYNRSAKRCKEKWENINKYYKKVKENNKARPEDSKTCPYFHQLDAIYKEKLAKPDSRTMVPLMVRPEQQWPPQQELSHRAAALMEEGADKDNPDQIQDNEDDGDTEGEYEDNDFELVAKTAGIGNGGE